jgi:hypothetical protein
MAGKVVYFSCFSAPIVIRRYLHSLQGDVDQTKKLIDHSYALRYKYPHIFYDRDPNENAEVQKIFQVA